SRGTAAGTTAEALSRTLTVPLRQPYDSRVSLPPTNTPPGSATARATIHRLEVPGRPAPSFLPPPTRRRPTPVPRRAGRRSPRPSTPPVPTPAAPGCGPP